MSRRRVNSSESLHFPTGYTLLPYVYICVYSMQAAIFLKRVFIDIVAIKAMAIAVIFRAFLVLIVGSSNTYYCWLLLLLLCNFAPSPATNAVGLGRSCFYDFSFIFFVLTTHTYVTYLQFYI